MREQPVNQASWDYLIVLDACRYDFFRDNYSDFLEGELDKVESRGSATPEWLLNTFAGRRYNYSYITANPYVNKQGNALKDLVAAWDYEWYAGDKFTEIHEAWVEKWDEEINTVRPEKMKAYALENIMEGQSKTIIHFIQPHRPFISYEGDRSFGWAEKNGGSGPISLMDKILNGTRPLWKNVFYSLPKKFQNHIRKVFGRTNEYQKFMEELGEEKVRKYYEKDLRMAMEQVSELVDGLEGNVVVTADHGESFGEQYEWGHPIGSRNPVLVEVPWLEVEKE